MNLPLGDSSGFLASALVKISASYYVVTTRVTFRLPSLTASLKWWYFTAICFVFGLFLGTLANSSAPLLFSNGVQ